jgi:hypothetical protein
MHLRSFFSQWNSSVKLEGDVYDAKLLVVGAFGAGAKSLEAVSRFQSLFQATFLPIF